MKKKDAYDNLKGAIMAPRREGRIRDIRIALDQYENVLPWWKRLYGQNPATSKGRTAARKKA